MSNIGVYVILNKITNEAYVGQSHDMLRRLKTHESMLCKNKHRNQKLQDSFNKYGKNSFEAVVLENCDESELNDLELQYIDKYDSKNNGFNIYRGGGNSTVKRRYPSSQYRLVKIKESTKEKLYQFKSREETYDDVVLKLLHFYDKSITKDNYK